MSESDSLYRYDGARVLVVGGATGMGAAAAKLTAGLGAEVVVLDYAPVDFEVAQYVQVDLRDRAAVDAALAQVGGSVDALFSAAGVADGTPGIMKINFTAHRHIIDSLVGSGAMSAGGAICMISSVAGLGWEAAMPTLIEFLETPDFESAVAWVDAHEGTDNYGFSKQAMNCYVARQSYPFLAKGIRINAICPLMASTDTAAGAGQRRHLADVRPGLPRRHRRGPALPGADGPGHGASSTARRRAGSAVSTSSSTRAT